MVPNLLFLESDSVTQRTGSPGCVPRYAPAVLPEDVVHGRKRHRHSLPLPPKGEARSGGVLPCSGHGKAPLFLQGPTATTTPNSHAGPKERLLPLTPTTHVLSRSITFLLQINPDIQLSLLQLNKGYLKSHRTQARAVRLYTGLGLERKQTQGCNHKWS